MTDSARTLEVSLSPLPFLFCLAALAYFLTTPPSAATGENPAAEGAAHFKARRFEEALHIFEKVYLLHPSAPEARHNLAHARAALGQERLLDGDLMSAAELTDGALDLLPEEHGFHLLRARIAFEGGDLYEARRQARMAIDPKGKSPLAREFLGDIHYQAGDLRQAMEAWRSAVEEGSSRASEKVSRLLREMDAENDFGRDVSLHFTLQYDGPVSREVSRSVLKALERSYDRIGGYLGSYPKSDILVILYSQILYREITDTPQWSSGSFDGKIRLPVKGVRNEADVKRILPVLTHELTHSFLRSMAPRGLPLWFEEGLARHLAELAVDSSSPSGSRAGDTFEDFSQLDRGLRGEGPSVRAAYDSAHRAVLTIIEYSGDWSLRRVVEKVGRGIPFDRAVETATGLSLQRLESRWRRPASPSSGS